MKKKLKTSGNGWELYFSKSLLRLLGYNPVDTKILITSKNNCLYLEPITDPEKFQNHMIRNFQKSGGSYAIYFPATLIEILGINPETDYVELEIYNSSLMIKGI